jgi:hypothetical protein
MLIVGAAVLALLSIGAGSLIAVSDDEEAAPSPSPSATVSPTASPSPSEEPSESAEPSPSPVIDDGRHFVFVTEAARLEDGSTTVTFDLAYFLTGEAGEQAAAEHDDEFVNDYYIVNDNTRLRTLPLADEVRVRYIPTSVCCELQPGNIDAWLEAIFETNQTDYGGQLVPWWITVEGGAITKIEQQYLP